MFVGIKQVSLYINPCVFLLHCYKPKNAEKEKKKPHQNLTHTKNPKFKPKSWEACCHIFCHL